MRHSFLAVSLVLFSLLACDRYVESGTTYSYRVRAFNSAGDSAPSDPVSATACFVEVDSDGFYACVVSDVTSRVLDEEVL